MHEDNPRFAFWFDLPQEQRDSLDQLAHESILELPRWPFWSPEICAELLGWQRLEIDVLNAHNKWLERLKARAERRGRTWDRTEFLRQCRLTEAGD
ncbi:hypothetical protein [Gordonia sp. NPDC003429]